MQKPSRLFDRQRLLVILALLLVVGFAAVSLFGYLVSRQAIRTAIVNQDLPLTSSNIYSEIQRDLIRPVLISSTMAHDTFVRAWVLGGEKNVEQMAAYLAEIKKRYGAFSSFLVSDKTRNYYTAEGILKRISPDEARDVWYYRVKEMAGDYEINVDPDLANRDALTIFINYRVADFDGNYMGATGIGLTVEAVRRLVNEYQHKFARTIYFVAADGQIVLSNGRMGNLHEDAAVAPLLARIQEEKQGSYQFVRDGDTYILNVNYLPELKWYLFVEQNEDKALESVRQTLYVNLLVSLLVTLVVVYLTYLALGRYQSRLEEMAVTDELTGLFNRHAFSILQSRLIAAQRREGQALSVLLLDVDFFKRINDQYGHQVGDQVLAEVAASLRFGIRDSDVVVRWGGEEFLIVLANCDLTEARRIADNLRRTIAEAAFASLSPGEVTCSIGVAAFSGGAVLDTAINQADEALYQAKGEGRNRVSCVGAV